MNKVATPAMFHATLSPTALRSKKPKDTVAQDSPVMLNSCDSHIIPTAMRAAPKAKSTSPIIQPLRSSRERGGSGMFLTALTMFRWDILRVVMYTTRRVRRNPMR